MKAHIICLLSVVLVLGNINTAYSQDDTHQELTLNSFYEDYDQKLLVRHVIETDSVGVPSLKNKIKNWVGLRFRSGEQVLVNETENQLIVNFVSMDLKGNTGISTVVLPWHIRLVIEIKANKVRVSAFDDMGSASTSISRSYYLSAYFKKDGTIKMPNTYKNGFLQFKETIASLVRDLEKSILQPTTSDDW